MDSDGSRFIFVVIMLLIFAAKILLRVCEIALVNTNASRAGALAEKDDKYKKLPGLIERAPYLSVTFTTGKMLFTALFAVAAAFFTLGSFGGLNRLAAFLICAAGSAVLFAAVTEIMPKKLVKNGEKTAARLIPVINIFMVLLSPFSLLTYGITALLCLVFRIPVTMNYDEITEEKILMMVDEGNQSGVIEQSQREMINNIFEFGDSVVSEAMTHRTDLCSVDVETKIGDVVYLAINEGYSRIPVYEKTIDSIIGILYVKDLLCLVGCEHSEDFTVRQFMRKAKFIPETCRCADAFEEMTKEKCQLSVVVDEYGGTAGIITLEDLLEEIVGNIQDEFDDEKADISEISDGVYTISGNMNPEDAAEVIGIELPEEHDYDTMSAFIVDLLGRIPDEDENASVEYGGVEFIVLLAEDNWVSRIKAVCKNRSDKSHESEKDIEQ